MWVGWFFLDTLRESLLHASSWWLLAVLGFPGLMVEHPSKLYLHLHTAAVPLCVSLSLLLRIPVIALRPTLLHCDLLLTNYICKDPTFRQCHILRLLVDSDIPGEHCLTQYSRESGLFVILTLNSPLFSASFMPHAVVMA